MSWLLVVGGAVAGALLSRATTRETIVSTYAGSSGTVTITETTKVIELRPDPYYEKLYIDHIDFTVDNPANSGVTLTLTFNAVLDNLSEVTLHTASVAAGRSMSDTIILVSSAVPAGRHIVLLRVYATLSTTPLSGYEPRVTVKAYGLQIGRR